MAYEAFGANIVRLNSAVVGKWMRTGSMLTLSEHLIYLTPVESLHDMRSFSFEVAFPDALDAHGVQAQEKARSALEV